MSATVRTENRLMANKTGKDKHFFHAINPSIALLFLLVLFSLCHAPILSAEETSVQEFSRLSLTKEFLNGDVNHSNRDTTLGQSFLGQSFLPRPIPSRRSYSLPGLFDRFDFSGSEPFCGLQRTRFRTWIRGAGNWQELKNTDFYGQLDIRSLGISLGLDQQFGRDLLIGLALGASETTFKSKQIGIDENASAFFGSLYARKTLQRLFFDLEFGLGSNETPSWNTEGKSSDFQWNVRGEFGTWWQQGLGRIEPHFGLRYAEADFGTRKESKSTLQAGIRYSWKTVGSYAVNSPRIYAGLFHELGNRNLAETLPFSDSAIVCLLPDGQIAKTRFYTGGGITSSLGASLDLYLRYTALITSDHFSHTIWFGTNWNF